MNMGSLPPLDPLAPQTLHTYSSCGIGQWQKEEKSSSLKLDATNLILRLRQRCETRTFEASQESSPSPSGPTAASSSRSLNPASGKRHSKIKHRTSRAEKTESKSDLISKAVSSAVRSWGRSSHHHQPTRTADLALASSCAVTQKQSWRLIRRHGPPRDGEICRCAARSGRTLREDTTRLDSVAERTDAAMKALDPVVEAPVRPQQRSATSTERWSSPAPASEGEEEQGREATFTWVCSRRSPRALGRVGLQRQLPRGGSDPNQPLGPTRAAAPPAVGASSPRNAARGATRAGGTTPRRGAHSPYAGVRHAGGHPR